MYFSYCKNKSYYSVYSTCKIKLIFKLLLPQCAFCGKEAIFYCCWNTSYCDYPCQQNHWPTHMHTCLQTNKNKTASATSTGTTASTSAAGRWFHLLKDNRKQVSVLTMYISLSGLSIPDGIHPGKRSFIATNQAEVFTGTLLFHLWYETVSD